MDVLKHVEIKSTSYHDSFTVIVTCKGIRLFRYANNKQAKEYITVNGVKKIHWLSSEEQALRYKETVKRKLLEYVDFIKNGKTENDLRRKILGENDLKWFWLVEDIIKVISLK